MHKWLLAVVLLSVCGSVVAQSTPAFQTGSGNSSQAANEMFFLVEQLRDEVRSLRGTIEEQQHRIEQLSKQTRDRYVDLDSRLLELSERIARLEDGPPQQGAAPAQGSSAGNSGNAASQPARAGGAKFRPPNDYERRSYQAIQEKIRDKQYSAAINDLYQFITEFPEGDLTVNAYYWLGEVYLVQGELEQARQAFTIVTARFPEHRKAADALYKLGVTQDRLGEKEEARSTMESVVEQYPQSNAADLARDYLARNGG